MKPYVISNSKTGETIKVEANSPEEASLKALEDMGFVVEEAKEIKHELKMFNQKDYPDVYLGFSKKYTLATDGCFITCLTVLYNYYNGTNITPPEFNEMMKDANGFINKAFVNSDVAAKLIGIRNLGREYDIDKTPESKGYFEPTIKDVDFSPARNKQQHFVIRVYDKKGNYILDPWGGIKRVVGYYETLNDYKGWDPKTPNKESCNYRLFVK